MTCFGNRRAWPAALALAVLWVPARADEAPSPAVFPAESKPTAGRIDEIRKLLAAHKWADAVEQIQSVLTASGDDLVPLDPNRSVACRRLCQSLLASLPPDALRSYRDGADGQARKWLDQATATRDARLLRRVVDEAFCSRPGEKALDLLGDLAFERGDFAEAESWWGRLIPPAVVKGDPPPAFALFYPDPQTDPARTRAKVLLARLFRGAYGWADDLQAYRKTYGTAEGALAGKNGRYADILQQVADERDSDPPAPTTDWPTFGGDASRGRTAVAPPRLLERLGALCRSVNEHQFGLKDRQEWDEEPPPAKAVGPILLNRSMAFEPVVVDGKAIVADARYVTAYDLRTGAVEKWYDAAKVNGVHPDLNLPAPPDLRYSPTVAGDRVFVRLGTQSVRDAPTTDRPKDGEKPAPTDEASLLVCLSLRPAADGGRELWSIRAGASENLDKDKAYTVFEGSPLVHDDLLYVASTRFLNGRAVTRVQCYPADAAGEPRERWRQDVCETHEFAERDRRYRQHLLTMTGPYVVYCSHSGAIAALDALTGKPAWAVRYPSRGDKTADGEPSPRDLAPCLFADGRLYVAPADYDRLLCLDAATGETLWQRGPLEVVHLLGVGEGRLIFTTPTGLRAVGADDGVDAWALPDGGGALAPAGRGLLIGDLVLWPTASKGPGSFTVYAVRQRDGSQPDDPSLLSHIPAGNLVYADGCLLCADRRTLTIFTPPSMRLEEKEGQSRAEPESPSAALELARSEADAGLTGRALESYARAERLGVGLSAVKRKRLGETVRREKHALLLDAGRRAETAKRWDEADGLFKQASIAEFADPSRLQALLETAALWKSAGRDDRAAVARQTILDAKGLADLTVMDEAGTPRRPGDFVAAHTADPPKRHDAATEPAPCPPPYFRVWQAALDPGETVLAVADDVLSCGSYQPEAQARDSVQTSLALRVSDTGKVRWRTPLPFAPAWADRTGGVIVTAGAGGAAGLRADDGRVAWEYAAPPASPTFPTPAGTVLAPTGRPDPFGNFHLLGGRLLFAQGQRRLFALDVESGRVLWTRWAPGARLRQPPPDGRFFHVCPVSADLLLVQTSGGRRWLLDAATGNLLHDDPTAGEPWPRTPVLLPDGGVCITTDARTVVRIDPASGRDVWTYTLPGVTTRTGEAPRLAVGPDALMLAWATNIGWRLRRLDPAKGTPFWNEPPLVNVGELDVDGWSVDADAFYGVQDRVLFARSLKDGAVLWERPLAGPAGRWRTRRVGDALFAYPAATAGVRFQFRWLAGALQWEGWLPPRDESGREYPVVCCDPRTGRLVQRLNFPVDPQAFVHLDPDGGGALPAIAVETVEWRPRIYVSAHGLVVAAADGAWGLSAK